MITGATIPTLFWRASNLRTGERRPKNRFSGIPFLSAAMFLTLTSTISRRTVARCAGTPRGRPTRELAGTNPRTGRSPTVACSRSLVRCAHCSWGCHSGLITFVIVVLLLFALLSDILSSLACVPHRLVLEAVCFAV